MNKIYQIIAVALVGLAMPMLSACGDDDFEEKVSSVKVMSATSVIPVMGGTGTINVAGEGITATSSANWLKVSVSGNTVKMVGDANTSKQSRNALVTISAANGDKTAVNVSQVGMVIDLIADDRYLFEEVNNSDAEITSHSNVIFQIETTDSWIKMNRTEKGYTLNVEDNTGDELRKGSVTLKYADYSKKINVVQWGKEYPFATMNTATYKNENGVEQTKAITVEKNPSKEGQYLVKGLVAEADVLLIQNTEEGKKEFYIPSGCEAGTKKVIVSGSEKTYYQRCMMSCVEVSDGKIYIPESTKTTGLEPFRMSFKWDVDDNCNPCLLYFRNAELDVMYNTDGVKIYLYKQKSGVAKFNRYSDTPTYTFTDIKFSN